MIRVQAARFCCVYTMTAENRLSRKDGFAKGAGEHQNEFQNDI